MDADRFDVLARIMAASPSRRVALRGLAGALPAAILRLPTEDAAARCVKLAKKCDKKRDKCCGGAKCKGRKCKCAGGTAECGTGTCIDVLDDATNCGECGVVCDTGTCVHGTCSCGSNPDCPSPCTCSVRVEGGAACRGNGSCNVGTELCETDADCPPRSFCGPCGDEQRCSIPCDPA